MAEDDASRRLEELDALQAFYGDDLDATIGVDGPWRITIGEIVLELLLPSNYPSLAAPSPRIHAPEWILNEAYALKMVEEMLEMWTEDTEVAILWAEHCRAAVDDNSTENNSLEYVDEIQPQNEEQTESDERDGVRIFYPYTSKYGQSVRQFDSAVILNECNKRQIHRGSPYHPPKSGPSETMIAHVASVQRMDHVDWVIADLLFNDKKVAKATHNMIAYRFWDEDRDCMVSDNDDDGEKGAGKKLAALLEMTDAVNVIVVVSRWYGGTHLGPSRFKHIASTARQALERYGFLKEKR